MPLSPVVYPVFTLKGWQLLDISFTPSFVNYLGEDLRRIKLCTVLEPR